MKEVLQKEKQLIKRYLVWCYKTTKESLDRIDRYYTQLVVDKFVLDNLNKTKKSGVSDKDYLQLVSDFEQYMKTKKENVDKKKFLDTDQKKLTAEYQYLKNRFAALEKAIVYFLGKKELQNITNLYEQEMTRRILEAREHS